MQTARREVLVSAAGLAAAGLAAAQQGDSIVNNASRCVTPNPGAVIYTGTPNTTRKMSPGDVVEVDIEGIGALRNKVIAG
jgi:hypothetical protein